MDNLIRMIENSDLIESENKLKSLIALDYIKRFSSKKYKENISLIALWRSYPCYLAELFIWDKHEYGYKFWSDINTKLLQQ